jgi:hypothetical protein
MPGLCYTGDTTDLQDCCWRVPEGGSAVTVLDTTVRFGSTPAAHAEAHNAVAEDLAGELTQQPARWR